MTTGIRVLVIDDEPLMREYVEEALLRAGYAVDTASNGAEGVQRFEKHAYDVVVTDLKMKGMTGIDVLRAVLASVADAQVIVMTAYGTIETAVDALKSGAADYILKPFTPDAIEIAVARALERARLKEENRYLRGELGKGYDAGGMIGQSPALRAVHEQIRKVADSRATVLVRGESGTGKELVARAIHASGRRKDNPFIKLNCAALSAGILESELFGHEKGAFTGAHERKIGRFELADTGTLLLDEVSEISMELQPKLLRALQEREFERVGGVQTIRTDVHIVATSNRRLEEAVEKGQFRQDLFFRLNVVDIHLPPLRERKDDVPLLMEHFLKRYTQENARKITGFSAAARKLFLDYDWPGNVRELQNAIERAVVLADSEVLEPEHFPLAGPGLPGGGRGLEPGKTVAEVEKDLILCTLAHCGQNRTKAADMLGISVRTLRNKLHEYNADTGGDEDDDGGK
jgi:DNA-binding NtrC family response regulator